MFDGDPVLQARVLQHRVEFGLVDPDPAVDPELVRDRPGIADMELVDLLERASDYAARSKSAATLRAHDSAWRDFVRWCSARYLDPLPTAPGTVVTYVADLAPARATTTIATRIVAIGQAHRMKRLPDPTIDPPVKAVLRGVGRQHGRPARGKDPLLVGDLISIVQAHDLTPMQGLRDRALLLLGFSAALRRSELVALEVADPDFRPMAWPCRSGEARPIPKVEGVPSACRTATTAPAPSSRSGPG